MKHEDALWNRPTSSCFMFSCLHGSDQPSFLITETPATTFVLLNPPRAGGSMSTPTLPQLACTVTKHAEPALSEPAFTAVPRGDSIFNVNFASSVVELLFSPALLRYRATEVVTSVLSLLRTMPERHPSGAAPCSVFLTKK